METRNNHFSGAFAVKLWEGSYISRWWQLKHFLMFTTEIGEDEPILTNIFGLKPPTGFCLQSWGSFAKVTLIVSFNSRDTPEFQSKCGVCVICTRRFAAFETMQVCTMYIPFAHYGYHVQHVQARINHNPRKQPEVFQATKRTPTKFNTSRCLSQPIASKYGTVYLPTATIKINHSCR